MTTDAPQYKRSGVPPNLRAKELEDRLGQMRAGVVSALAQMLDLRDLVTGRHATRLADLAVQVGERLDLGESELLDVEVASLLHDVGKVGVADDILLKPGKLDADERNQVQKHPEYGWTILRTIPTFEQVSLLVLHHHERWDGGGYPGGLSGTDIPLGARIVAVVDTFDAMLNQRSYRPGLALPEARRRLNDAAGNQLDPGIVPLFQQLIDEDKSGLLSPVH